MDDKDCDYEFLWKTSHASFPCEERNKQTNIQGCSQFPGPLPWLGGGKKNNKLKQNKTKQYRLKNERLINTSTEQLRTKLIP